MAGPVIEKIGGLYRLSWPHEEISSEVSHLRQHRDGGIAAEIVISSKLSPLIDANLNISSLPTRRQWAKELAERWPALEETRWKEVMEEMCRAVKTQYRNGDPASLITTEDEVSPPQDLIHPILPYKHVTVLFGDGETGKSLFALVLAVVALLPWADNPLGLAPRFGPMDVLYLDWESDRADLQWRLKMLRNGMGLPYVRIHYRRCTQTLADDFDAIRRIALQTEAQFIIVDSAALAAGLGSYQGDPAGPPSALYAALRELGQTSLVIAHRSKADREGKGAAPYSSVFFRNLPRSVWETRLSQDPKPGTISMLLTHNKANLTARHDPLAFTFRFAGDSLTVSATQAMSVPDFADSLKLPPRILYSLHSGRYTRDELLEKLGAGVKKDTLRKALDRLIDSGQVECLEGYYQLWQPVSP